MKEHIIPYKERLSKKIGEYMELPVNDKTAAAIDSMMECWETIDKLEKMIAAGGTAAPLTVDEAKSWANHMENADDTNGPHWNMEQTTAVANSNGVEFTHVSEWCWWVTLNMMYSDYYSAAVKYGVNTPGFYADMAKAFLFDKDGPAPKEKLAAYYNYIVKKH